MKLCKIFLILVCICLYASCSNFLDVQPKNVQSEKQLFAARGGFYTAVNGVYDKLSSASLYGGNLSYSLVDVIAKCYEPMTSSMYFQALVTASYSESFIETQLSSIWREAYNAILNCNVIIENVDKNEGILSEQEAALIKGEMLAVRACLHFDMLRLFGPVYKNDPTALSIPYNESSQVSVLPLLPIDSILEYKILRDLQQAERLIEGNDPIIENGPMASLEDDQDVYLRYRQLRFNYYAILGLMARVYLYAEDYTNALTYATKLLNDPKVHEHFPPVDPNKLLANQTNPDRVFSTEVLVGIYAEDRDNIYTSYFDPAQAGSNLLLPRSYYVSSYLFAGATQDYRRQSQWENATITGMQGRYSFVKYKTIAPPEGEESSRYFYAVLISLIRLSEMYYIAAECEPILEDGYDWLNQIRAMRGLTSPLPVISKSDLMDNLRKEYLREFWGEGQIFFMFKRLYADINSNENGWSSTTWEASNAYYVLPLPAEEIANR